MTREEELDWLCRLRSKIYVYMPKEWIIPMNNALDMAIKALKQEPCGKDINVSTTDAISRQAVLDGVDRYIYKSQSTGTQDDFYSFAELVVKQLPPVTPQPKTGHWEWVQYDYNPKLGNWHCSECRCVFLEFVEKNEKSNIPLYKYCPQCGAKMIEPQESEDKK